jgi:hypothetical protein
MVPVTREESRYLEPSPLVVTRRNGEGGSDNWGYMEPVSKLSSDCLYRNGAA